MSTLLDISVIFRCFLVELPSPNGASFRILCLRILVEHWQVVLKWLTFLFMVSHSAENTVEILSVCVDTLIPVVMIRDTRNLEDDTRGIDDEAVSLTEELVYLPYTIDFVFLLFAQRNRTTGSYYHLKTAEGRCKITKLFCQYLKTLETFQPMVERLGTLKPRTRQAIIRSLVERSMLIAGAAVVVPAEQGKCRWAIMDGVRSVCTLILSTTQLLPNPSFYALFARRDFVDEYSAALAILSKGVHERYGELSKRGDLEGFWESISAMLAFMVKTVIMRLTPNLGRSFASAIRGGAIDTALRALCHLPPEGDDAKTLIEDVLAACLPYFTLRKVWLRATLQRGNAINDVLLSEAGRTSPKAADACKAITQGLRMGEGVYGASAATKGKKGVSLCGNRKVMTFIGLLQPSLLSQFQFIFTSPRSSIPSFS